MKIPPLLFWFPLLMFVMVLFLLGVLPERPPIGVRPPQEKKDPAAPEEGPPRSGTGSEVAGVTPAKGQ